MTISFYKSKCLVCWKGFEVPLLSDSSYGDTLYYDKTNKEYYYFNWFDNKEIENSVIDFLNNHQEFQIKNDDDRGNTARKIVGIMADGNKENVIGYNRCPRCGIKFNFVTGRKTEVKEIENLNFSNYLNLDINTRNQILLEKLKNSL